MVLGFVGGTVRGSSHLKKLNFELFVVGVLQFCELSLNGEANEEAKIDIADPNLFEIDFCWFYNFS